ncbi:phospholipase D family protein [Falsibacillus pallidus]|uniref:phospholipase D family protein n=1 Tax=Falsibacillus pallidus TaxID=493781 RepID=UPI003D96C3F7
MPTAKKRKKKKWTYILIIVVCAVYLGMVFYESKKPLPKGLSYESKVHHVDNVNFLYDLTYQKDKKEMHDQMIFQKIFDQIDKADKFIVIDMFLFNDFYDKGMFFPPISDTLTKKLIDKKEKNPEMRIVFITDPVNTGYSSFLSKQLKEMKDNGIEIVVTDLEPLRDSNPLYSAIWRIGLQWFGQKGEGWIRNPLTPNAPKLTVRSYLELMNIKANHRKTLATDKGAIVSSANPHDASGYHSNIAFETSGPIIADILKTEQSIIDFSHSNVKLPKYKGSMKEKGNIKIQLLTESKIQSGIVDTVSKTSKGDSIWIGMFYIADRDIVNALTDAAGRGVKIKLILDPNTNAFGHKKTGLPNNPVVSELLEEGKGNIQMKWYNTHKEQYHTKLIYVRGQNSSTVIGGSANYTMRNLDDFNPETDLKVEAANREQVIVDVDDYFHRIWNNEEGTYSVGYKKRKIEFTGVERVIYALQKLLHFTTY